jgi:hypothetical protein
MRGMITLAIALVLGAGPAHAKEKRCYDPITHKPLSCKIDTAKPCLPSSGWSVNGEAKSKPHFASGNQYGRCIDPYTYKPVSCMKLHEALGFTLPACPQPKTPPPPKGFSLYWGCGGKPLDSARKTLFTRNRSLE